MIARVVVIAVSGLVGSSAIAQDVPGIEICTVERDLNRRTSCLQSNVEFLQKQMTKQSADAQQKLSDAQQKLAAAASEISNLKGAVEVLRTRIEQLQAAAKPPATK
jgi:peptidoglycan hydrolase CwlO-like protein